MDVCFSSLVGNHKNRHITLLATVEPERSLVAETKKGPHMTRALGFSKFDEAK